MEEQDLRRILGIITPDQERRNQLIRLFKQTHNGLMEIISALRQADSNLIREDLIRSRQQIAMMISELERLNNP